MIPHLRWLRHLDKGGEVGSSAEALPGSRQHHGSDVGVIVQFFEGVDEVAFEIAVERVAALRAVHRQDRNRVVAFQEDGFEIGERFCHRCFRLLRHNISPRAAWRKVVCGSHKGGGFYR